MKLFSVLTLMVCLNSVAISATEDRIPMEELFEIEDQRLSQTPRNIIEQALPQLSYDNDNQYLDRIQKLAYTFPIGVINNGQKVRLVDDSNWFVNSVQQSQVCNWAQSDTIFIKPKSSCFSRYAYVLHNRTTHEAVEVNFVNMPLYYGAYRQKIAKIDYYSRVIQLDDLENTVWEISFGDSNFNYWKQGDYIIVGVNNDWRIANYPHILINASIKNAPYCESNFYGYGL
jgi:hypothetical protein